MVGVALAALGNQAAEVEDLVHRLRGLEADGRTRRTAGRLCAARRLGTL